MGDVEQTPNENLEAPGAFEDLKVEEAMAFDFFGSEGASEDESAVESAERVAEEVQAPEGTKPAEKVEETPAAATPVAKETQTQAQPNPELELLKQQNADLQRKFDALTESLTKAPPQQQQQQQQAGPERTFNIGIPDELIAGMASEDPIQRRNATQVLVNGVGDMIYAKVMKEVREFVPQAARGIVQTTHQEAEQHNQIQTDFYGKYPEFAKPELRIVVYSVANAVAKELGAREWSPALRDAIAARMKSIYPASPQQKVEEETPAKRRTTPRTVPTGARALPQGQTAVGEILGIGEF